MPPPSAHLLLYAGGIILISGLFLLRGGTLYRSFNIRALTIVLLFLLLFEISLMKAEAASAAIPRLMVSAMLAAVMWAGAVLLYREVRRKETSRLLMRYNEGDGDNERSGILIADSNGYILRHNSSMEKLLGHQKAGLIGKNILEVFPASVSDHEVHFLVGEPKGRSEPGGPGSSSDVALSDEPHSAKLVGLKYDEVRTALGKFKVFFVNVLPRKSRPDRVDIVKSGFYHFAPVIFVAVSPEGHIVMANEHFQDLLQLPQRQIVGRHWFQDFVPDERRDYCAIVFQRCIDSGEEQYFEAGILDGSGRKRLIRWKCGLTSFETGKLVLYCGEDITEQEAEHIQLMKSLHNLNKVTEELERRVRERTYDLETININLELQIEERKEIEKQLLNSERLHMAMAHNFPNGIIAVLDEHLRFVLVDGQDLETLGYSSEMLLGKYIFSRDFGLDVEAVDSLQRAFKGDTSLFEVMLQGVYYSLTAVPLPDYENQIGKILVVFQNISQHKKLEQSLYSSIDQERKLNELKSRFVTMASHEFRTPLSTILSSAFLLESYSGPVYEQKKYHHINLIKRTVNILTESLNDFLRLGKLEEGRVKLVLSDTDIEEYVSDIVREMQTIMKPGQDIRYEHHGIRLHVLVDRNLMRGILVNLLSNAGKYSPENTPVSVKTLLQEEQLIIQVADKGLGIPAEERQHIFDRFFRAVNALHIEGTGLGLHIVKKYVELMNGRIDFSSGDDGTTFTVEIPLHLTQEGTRLILR